MSLQWWLDGCYFLHFTASLYRKSKAGLKISVTIFGRTGRETVRSIRCSSRVFFSLKCPHLHCPVRLRLYKHYQPVDGEASYETQKIERTDSTKALVSKSEKVHMLDRVTYMCGHRLSPFRVFTPDTFRSSLRFLNSYFSICLISSPCVYRIVAILVNDITVTVIMLAPFQGSRSRQFPLLSGTI